MAKAQTAVNESNRMWASASFVGVLFIIGLPLWWKTTEVYRVALPYDKIDSFDSLPTRIMTDLTVLAYDETTASEIAGIIEKTFEDSDVIKVRVTKAILPGNLVQALDSVADETEALEEVSAKYDVTQSNTLLVVQRKPLFQDVWVSQERVVFFRNAQAATTLTQVLKKWVYQTEVLAGAISETGDDSRRIRMPPHSGYHIVLSVVAPKPEPRIKFDAPSAVEDYIGSFVDEMSSLHNFTLKSQWLYLLDFDFQGKEVPDSSEWGRHYEVSTERVQLLVTRLEERAAAHVAQEPSINLLLYAVPCAAAPLSLHDAHGRKGPVEAFMSPKWGGVVLVNPPAGVCREGAGEWEPAVLPVMSTFLAQLRRLLGFVDLEEVGGAHASPPRSVLPRAWSVDGVSRLRTLEHLVSARRTLKSLSQLLSQISNIVINDEVGASINAAVAHIGLGSQLLERGDLQAAYQASQDAHRAAERAFVDPSLLALLYFPDDQKYAIYIPLFLPIMFPVVLSLRSLLQWLRGKPLHKEKTD